MGSNTSQASVPPSEENCSAEMHLWWLTVFGKTLQGWGGDSSVPVTAVTYVQQSPVLVLGPKVLAPHSGAPHSLRCGCDDLGQIFQSIYTSWCSQQ